MGPNSRQMYDFGALKAVSLMLELGPETGLWLKQF